MKLIFFSFPLIIFSSCSSGTKTGNASAAVAAVPAKDSTLEKGKVIPKIKCKADSNINYSLYLPKNYSAKDKFPVIFFFDSHGSGDLPLKKYAALAEKYGYILAGSNNSKNGMRWEDNEPQIKVFMSDVKEKLNVDAKRIYACGFSGGSRVASSVAIFDGGIAGVIGMGAGFPSLSEPIRNKFDYIGFAGNEDYNMNEMVALDSSMNHSPIRHQFIIFNGKHEWAPDHIAEDAFGWCEVNAMKDGLISKNDTLIKSCIANAKQLLENCERDKQLFSALMLCRKMIAFYDGLADISFFRKKEAELMNSDAVKKLLAQKQKLVKEEVGLYQSLRNDFALKNVEWWKKEINSIDQRTKNKNDVESARMNKRLLNYLSLVAYMNCSSALQAKQWDMLETYLKIYEMAEPSNPEHQYMYAELFAAKKNSEKEVFYLQNAVKLGFDDVNRMQSDGAFANIQNGDAFKKIIEEMKNKKND